MDDTHGDKIAVYFHWFLARNHWIDPDNIKHSDLNAADNGNKHT
jgi:hypothetical protein